FNPLVDLLSLHVLRPCRFHPPMQKIVGVSPWMNALDGSSVAQRAKEDELFRRILLKHLLMPRE
ncbi:MAG: hypothetical protein QF619_14475, partial [Candidatus Binatia bacterium]|nr:hypothetical protein [Candidatus Binatia bacterium]